MKNPTPQELEWLQQLREGQHTAARELYRAYRPEMLSWLRREFGLQEADAADVFQECIIALVSGVQRGKVDALQCTLKTFLFAIAKNLGRKHFRHIQRNANTLDLSEADTLIAEGLEVPFAGEREQYLMQHLEALGDPCHSVLYMYYYRQFTHEVIADRLGYKSAEVVKTQKSRCLGQLRQLFGAGKRNN